MHGLLICTNSLHICIQCIGHKLLLGSLWLGAIAVSIKDLGVCSKSTNWDRTRQSAFVCQMLVAVELYRYTGDEYILDHLVNNPATVIQDAAMVDAVGLWGPAGPSLAGPENR